MHPPHRDQNDDAGFGLIEIVISIFLLAVLSLAFLPLLVQGLARSAANVTQASSVQLVNDRLEAVRASGLGCSAVTALAGTETTVDLRNVPLRITRIAGSCPSSYPGTVSYSVSVVRTDSNESLASASTLVLVAAN